MGQLKVKWPRNGFRSLALSQAIKQAARRALLHNLRLVRDHRAVPHESQQYLLLTKLAYVSSSHTKDQGAAQCLPAQDLVSLHLPQK